MLQRDVEHVRLPRHRVEYPICLATSTTSGPNVSRSVRSVAHLGSADIEHPLVSFDRCQSAQLAEHQTATRG